MNKTKNNYWKIRIIAIALLIGNHYLAPRYTFLILNSILAYIPIEIGFYLMQKTKAKKINFLIGFLLWVIMIPNTFYLLTDLYYLSSLKIFDAANTNGALKVTESLWRHYTFLVGTVFFYILIGVDSVEKIINQFYQQIKIIPKALLLGMFFILNGFGLYIGRFMRFHSLELFTKPQEIFGELYVNFSKIEYMVLGYLVILPAFIYYIVIRLIKNTK